MTRRSRITSLEQADATMKDLGPMLYSNGSPVPQVRKVLQVVAFQRGLIQQQQAEIARLQGGEQNATWQRKVGQ